MQDHKPSTIDIISYDCGWGCGDYGCQDGPSYAKLDELASHLNTKKLNTILTDLQLRAFDNRADYTDKHSTLPMTVHAVQNLAKRCFSDIKNNVTPIVIGGDHSAAIGTWSGITSALNANEDFGLIWIDAHMDAHTPETADQGKWGGWWHGMPVACLTGHGKVEFTSIANQNIKINPEHIVLIGIRSFEAGEEQYLKQHGITYYTATEVNEHGFDHIYQKALTHITENCSYFGLSIDLDGFDPQDAPGVGTPEKDGIRAKEALEALSGLYYHPKFKGLEIVEYNPHNDQDHKTADLIHALIHAVVKAG